MKDGEVIKPYLLFIFLNSGLFINDNKGKEHVGSIILKALAPCCPILDVSCRQCYNLGEPKNGAAVVHPLPVACRYLEFPL